MPIPLYLLFSPRRGWHRLEQTMPVRLGPTLLYPAFFSALPAVAWFCGTTGPGWRIGAESAVRLTQASALPIVVLFYLAMLAAIIGIGGMVHWMAQTYGASSTLAKGIALASHTATPLFVAGIAGFYPWLMLDLIFGLAAICYSVYLLYVGIPIVMRIPEERGFLFASAVVAACLVILIAIMGATVILWDMGAAPIFTD
jgi:hypothetical protein